MIDRERLLAVHPLIQSARGALTDEDYLCAERLLGEALEVAKDLEERHIRLREAAEEAQRALRDNATVWLTVAPILEAHVYEPRADGYVWNAWTRWGERAGKKAYAALTDLRAALKGDL